MKNIPQRIEIMLLLCINLVFLNLQASIYYVAPNGSNSNPGTEKNPWKNIQKAADIIGAGDTVYIRGGVYNEWINIKKSGSSDKKRIVYMAYPGENPVIDGTNVTIPDWKALFFSGDYSNNSTYNATQFITFDGFKIVNSSWYGIRLVRCNNWIIKNCMVYNIVNDAVVMNQVKGITIQKCEIYFDTYNENNGINIMGGDSCILEYNYCHNIPGHAGLQIIPDHSENDSGFCVDNIVRCNICKGCRTGMYFRNGVNLNIYNNLIIFNNTTLGYPAIDLDEGATSSGSFNSYSKIYNNSIVGYLKCIRNTACNLLDIKNNIFCTPSKDGLIFAFTSDANTGHSIDYNLYFGNTPDKLGINEINKNPEFIDSINGNYKLKKNSPAIDAGVTLPIVTTDLAGIPRPQNSGYDIGAYEFKNDNAINRPKGIRLQWR